MKFLAYLNSKKTDFFTTFVLFAAALFSLTQGINEETSFFVYLSGFFLYLLVARVNVWFALLFGYAIGALYGYVAYEWLTIFPASVPIILAIVLNGLLLSIVLGGSKILTKKFPQCPFVHVFALGFFIFVFRAIFHYSPLLPHGKAFLTVVNTPTVFDWLMPYFGASVLDIMTLTTGSLLGMGLLHIQKKQLFHNLSNFFLVFLILILAGFPVQELKKAQFAQKETVKVALLQGNFDWSWEERVTRTSEVLDYYAKETEKVAAQGAKVIIWPEYAVPIDILTMHTEIKDFLNELSERLDVVIVTGSLELTSDKPDADGKWIGYDLSLAFDPDKKLLEPYRAVYPATRNSIPGSKPIVFDSKHAAFPIISCFEVAVHKFVADYSNKNQPFDFLVGIANIQLFNGSDGIKRIQNHIRRLAMENGRYFVYVANTGPSMVIDPNGTYIHYSPLLTRDTAIVEIPKVKEPTLYSKLQELPLLLFFTGALCYIWIRAKKKSRKKSSK